MLVCWHFIDNLCYCAVVGVCCFATLQGAIEWSMGYCARCSCATRFVVVTKDRRWRHHTSDSSLSTFKFHERMYCSYWVRCSSVSFPSGETRRSKAFATSSIVVHACVRPRRGVLCLRLSGLGAVEFLFMPVAEAGCCSMSMEVVCETLLVVVWDEGNFLGCWLEFMIALPWAVLV